MVLRIREQPVKPAGRENTTNAAVGPRAALAQMVGSSGLWLGAVTAVSRAATGLRMQHAAAPE